MSRGCCGSRKSYKDTAYSSAAETIKVIWFSAESPHHIRHSLTGKMAANGYRGVARVKGEGEKVKSGQK